MKSLISVALSSALVAVFAGSAFAAPILDGFMLMQHSSDDLPSSAKNDCAGYFGSGFDNCNIFVNDDNNVRHELSQVIAKYDGNGKLKDVRSDLKPFNADQIEVKFEANDQYDGSWSYTPVEGSPAIRFWAAKAGPGFNLFWYLSNEDYASNGCGANDTSYYSYQCMNSAQEVQSGLWSTPDGKGLSHITFYNGSPTTAKVPEPGTAALLLTGALGLFAARRRQSRIAQA